ncbi:MAG: putative toxin-antitoxin system toxin component, PIN family [Candidatus Dormibacteria bacterium]
MARRVGLSGSFSTPACSFPPSSPPAALRLAFTEFELVVCRHLLEELEGVLRRPKFGDLVTPDEVEEFVDVIRRRAITVENPVIAEAVTRDPGDDYVIALAQAANVDHLVSGDKDLTSLGTVSPPVLSPGAFLDLL